MKTATDQCVYNSLIWKEFCGTRDSKNSLQDLSYQIQFNNLDRVPPHALASLTRPDNQERCGLFLTRLRDHLKSRRESNDAIDFDQIEKQFGPTLGLLLRHQNYRIQELAAETLGILDSSLSFPLFSHFSLGSTYLNGDLLNNFENLLSLDRREEFSRYQQIHRGIGEKPLKWKQYRLQDLRASNWRQSYEDSVLVLTSLFDSDIVSLCRALTLIGDLSDDKPQSYTGFFLSDQKIEATMVIASAFVFSSGTRPFLQYAFIRACSGLRSAPFLAALLEGFADSQALSNKEIENQMANFGIFPPLLTAHRLTSEHYRHRSLVKLIGLIDHPNDNLSQRAMKQLKEKWQLIKDLPPGGQAKVGKALFDIFIAARQKGRDSSITSHIADVIIDVWKHSPKDR
jgi:hypothetical protein